jgi:hypothetical protein
MREFLRAKNDGSVTASRIEDRRMVAAYREALISYWRSRFFSIVMLMIALETVLWTVKNSAAYGWLNNWLVWAADGFFIGAVIGLHVAGRLSDYRIRLIPHYREVHLAALATMLLAALAALIGWTQWRLDGPQAGSVGMIVLAMVAGCWVARFLWLGMVAAPIVIGVMFHPGGQMAIEGSWAFLDSPVVNLLLLLLAAVLLARFAVWLWNLTEEESLRLPPVGRAGFRGFECAIPKEEQRQLLQSRTGLWPWFNELACGWQDRRLEKELARRSSWPAWNLRRWMLVWPMVPIFFQLVFAVVVMTSTSYLISPHLPHPSDPGAILRQAFGPLTGVMLMLMFGGGMALRARRTFSGVEFLRPVTRQQFFKEWGTCLLCSWFAMLPLMIGLIAVCIPARTLLFRLSAPAVVDLVAVLSATFLAASAVLIWAARFRSLWAFCLAVGVSCGASPLAWDAWSFGAPLAIAGLIALGGLALLWDAYRRWLITDLG